MAVRMELAAYLAEQTLLAEETAVCPCKSLITKPADYPYPHPDFLQLIFVARANVYKPEAKTEGEYELETSFRPVAEAQALPLSDAQRALLRWGLTRYGDPHV